MLTTRGSHSSNKKPVNFNTPDQKERFGMVCHVGNTMQRKFLATDKAERKAIRAKATKKNRRLFTNAFVTIYTG